MGTEKSLLTWKDVKHSLDKYHYGKENEIHIPIGIDEDGNVKFVTLDDSDNRQHMSIMGVSGSGKTTALHWAMAGLQRMYKKNLRVWFIDGMDCESRQLIDRAGNPRFYCDAKVSSVYSSYDMFDMFMQIIEHLGEKQQDSVQEVIVMEEVGHLLSGMPEKDLEMLSTIINSAPGKRTHIIYTSQSMFDVDFLSDTIWSISDWQAVCCTRVDKNTANKLQGVPLAATAVQHYGSIVVKNEGAVDVLRVPFVGINDMKDISNIVD